MAENITMGEPRANEINQETTNWLVHNGITEATNNLEVQDYTIPQKNIEFCTTVVQDLSLNTLFLPF